jgi:hypothetical protein
MVTAPRRSRGLQTLSVAKDSIVKERLRVGCSAFAREKGYSLQSANMAV